MIRSRAFVRRICSASLAVILDLPSWSTGNIPQPSRNDLNSYKRGDRAALWTSAAARPSPPCSVRAVGA